MVCGLLCTTRVVTAYLLRRRRHQDVLRKSNELATTSKLTFNR